MRSTVRGVRWATVGILIATGCATSSQGAGPTVDPATTPGQLAAAPAEGGHHGGGSEPTSRPLTLETIARGALLLEDLGTHHRSIRTAAPEAQAYFDQGLRLLYGFNHDEAARSFAHAAQVDPACAMCFWGAAYALGPNYNVPMLPDRARAAWEALTRARALAPKAPPLERALIEALARRYQGPAPLDPAAQQPFTEAYAVAMREVARRFPDDDDVQVLFAESLMDANPWKLWTAAGLPAAGTPELVDALERVIARSPQHPGANHYYIHAVEASTHPERALPSAERLAGLIPGAGHVVHMPAHIYQRVGRYAEASEHNRRAAEVDRDYIAVAHPFGYYPMYLGHNYGFLAYSASMLGRAEESLRASRQAAEALPPDMLEMMPGMDFFAAEPLLVMVRFGRWSEALAEPRPPQNYHVLTTLWHHARGMALASTGKLAEARAELAALRTLRAQLSVDLMAGTNPATLIADLGAKAIEARLAEREGKRKEAVRLWTEAVVLEDSVAYNEPADWFYPLRHFLGAALLDAGRSQEAEAVYREDLRRNPKNGWALYGLWRALAAQGKPDAARALQDFQQAWRLSDVKLARSAY